MRPTLSSLVRRSLLAEASSPALRTYPGGAMRYDEDRAAEESGEYFQNEAALRALARHRSDATALSPPPLPADTAFV